ncbi:wax ester/triacylglycerol synthase family O-acyltransferase [Sinimarinibacterium sp. CAU 1509]|uniref:WS/DGAT/MGAT family O-acyltransferase n=1 Tax=Sinimarinibacterium sp. CAU 1509 TaxID=2562283 RepID=UPI0010AB6F17|nr:wax ester/triacylglycerol synthase family O-acyltransferase [Sinimarinibacterium sp. CAU 1509]TJY64906.1 wax ester/triacylglycerol synthase family O-acyltransferase [Sinimarinibacterium sp. CAU 1509]
MNYLSPIDAAFLRMESINTPMHVGAMMTFKLPEHAPRDFLQRLLAQMREHPFMPKPFDCKLAHTRLSGLAPAWVETEVDMDYHLRHSALPFPGGERELGILVARLHSHPLDLSRPLWECHIIEGLENHRFAIYFKAHHCAIDGMGAMRMVQRWLSHDPNETSAEGPWVLAAKPPEHAATSKKQAFLNRLKQPVKLAGEQVRSLPDLARALVKMSKGEDAQTRAALTTPRSLFNVPITQQRRLGTQILDLSRIKAIGEKARTSTNDVLMAICGGAIRRYLLEHGALPERSLLASVPMGLARPDGKAGNAVAGFVCALGTEMADPAERLARIHRISVRAKEELSEMSPIALSQFALIGMSPLILGQMTGALPKLPPIFNFVLSNVVLSKKPMYLMGAELEAMYPVSFLFDGYALNITLVGYADKVAVGFLGCRDAIPRLQRLAVYTSDALTELEQAVGIAPPAATKKAARKSAPAKKAKKATKTAPRGTGHSAR